MLLTDRQIKERNIVTEIMPQGSGKRLSSGYSSFGFDPTLNDQAFLLESNPRYNFVDIKNPQTIRKNILIPSAYKGSDDALHHVFYIDPHGYMIGQTNETFNIPENVFGVCVGKSTYARAGIIVNVTPLEPGWYGKLTLEISNVTSNRVCVYVDEGICQIVFFEGQIPDKIYKGLYNGQQEPTLPRVRVF